MADGGAVLVREELGALGLWRLLGSLALGQHLDEGFLLWSSRNTQTWERETPGVSRQWPEIFLF